MKNKHLVLLFLLALVVGLLTRKLPWIAGQLFETELVRIDTAGISQLSITLPGRQELSFERTESAWVVTYDFRSVVAARQLIDPMLNALSPISSIRIVKSNRPDTLGLSSDKQIELRLFKDEKANDKIEIGKEILEKGAPATYIQLGDHEGIYLVKGHLRSVFSKTIDDFRTTTVVQFEPEKVNTIVLDWPEYGQFRYEKNDSTGFWIPSADTFPILPDERVMQWLTGLQRLNTSRFADNFDEIRAHDAVFGRVLIYSGADGFGLTFFHLARPDVPEEIPENPPSPSYRATYFVYSSQNTLNYFALPDTLMARQVCYGLCQPQPLPGEAHKAKDGVRPL